MLKAIAEKLIPGIPEKMRISILQQTDASDANTDDAAKEASSAALAGSDSRTVLEEVIDKATARSELERDISSMQTSTPLPLSW